MPESPKQRSRKVLDLLQFFDMEEPIDYTKLSALETIEAKQKSVRKALTQMESQLLKDGVLLTQSRQAIIDLPFTKLLENLKSGRIKAEETLQAFQAKALIETKKTNCITEFIPHAEKWANDRDTLPPSERGILHGLPVSIKENFDVQGMDTTLGLTKRVGQPAERNSVLVEVLLHQGAVPFVKTNVPQLIYSVGCSNPIFGATTNPYDSSRSSGGSSGGEAALITGGGSVLGIGTDMFGSIRIPASFCGTFGIKPCQKRISRNGCYGTFKSMIAVANTSGLLGRDVDALATGMEALLTDDFMCQLDPVIPHLPWRKDLYECKRPLTIGWLEEDDLLPVTPGVKRAIKLSREALRRRGHTLVPFEIPQFKDMYDCGIDIIVSEGGKAMLRHWEGGEIVDDSVKFNKKVLSAPYWMKSLIETYLSFWSPLLSKMASQKARQSSELWNAVGRQKELADEMFKVWKSQGLDVVLGPAFPLPAPHPVHHGDLMPACLYFGLYNLFDMPAGSMPVTFETEEDQEKLPHFSESDYMYTVIKKTTKGAVGLPLCVQIGGLPWQEETVLYAMKELEVALQESSVEGEA